jgi:hypothetical protein
VSFTVAAKHLFRHLHSPAHLRKNHLVERFFADPSIGRAGEAGDDACVLERIHELVRRGATACRDADQRAGKDQRATRQYAIVTSHCLAQRPLADVAAAMCISTKHLYRERAEICGRVARFVAEYDDTPTLEYLSDIDEWRVLAERATRLAAFGDVRGALEACDDLLGRVSEAQHRIELLRIISSISLSFERIADAERALRAARDLFEVDGAGMTGSARAMAAACIDSIDCDISSHRGDSNKALELTQRSIARLESIQRDAPLHVRELYVDCLYASSALLCNLGRLEQGYDFNATAMSNLHRIRPIFSELRARIVIDAWRLRNRLLTTGKAWYPSWQRVRGLTSAFEQSYAAGLSVQAGDAMTALAEHHSATGNDDEALASARFAMLLARQHQQTQLRTQRSIALAVMLQWTKHWEYGLSIVPAVDAVADCDGYHRELHSYLRAVHALRVRNFAGALAFARSHDRSDAPNLAVRRRLVVAEAAHELGEKRKARSLIEATTSQAELLGIASILRDAYHVSAKLTGRAHFKQREREIARLLTA